MNTLSLKKNCTIKCLEYEELKMQYEILLNKLIELEKTENELKKIINSFSVAYDQNLGKYIQEFLLLRKNWYEAESLKYPEKLRMFEEACADYESYRKIYSDSLDETVCALSTNDQIVIKKLWKKACKLCHPDIVFHKHDIVFRKQAEETFVKLNNAYKENDLNQIKEILFDLERGIFSEGKDDYTNNKEYIIRKIKHIKYTIQRLEKEIKDLQNSSTYKKILKIENWNDYFSRKKEEFKEKIKLWKKYHFNEA